MIDIRLPIRQGHFTLAEPGTDPPATVVPNNALNCRCISANVSTVPVAWPASRLRTSRYGVISRSRWQKPTLRPRSLSTVDDNARLIWWAN